MNITGAVECVKERMKIKETWLNTLLLTGIIVFLLGVVNLVSGLVLGMHEEWVLVAGSNMMNGAVSIVLGFVMMGLAWLLSADEPYVDCNGEEKE